uniref:Putative secreted protein n=1 Tax=Ixodes ricinus TaxID=34613 RepID=A0A6B0TZK2_IXORI
MTNWPMKCSFAVLHFIMCRHAANVNCHPTLRLTCIISVLDLHNFCAFLEAFFSFFIVCVYVYVHVCFT